MAKTTCSGYNKTVAHAFPIGGPEAARLVAEQSGKLCPVELYHTQSDQKRLFLGSEIIAPYVHTPVASVSDLTGVYLRTSRGVWRGDSVFVSGDGCTYTVVTGYGTGAVWRRDDTSAVQKYAGVIVQPTISTGYLSIGVSGDGLYGLYSVDQPSILQQYTFAGGNFALTDNAINYLLATNTGDGAKLTVSTNRNDVEGNFRTVIPIVTLPVDNGEVHQMSWAEGGHAMPEKHGNFLINNFRFVRDGLAGGLMLGEASGRAVTLTAGKVWYGGISSINLDAFDSRSGSNFWLYEDRGTGWVRYLTGQYNNTSYQSTSGFAELQNTNRYAINWIYRTVGDDVRCLSVLGTADYDLASAEAAGVPARLPPIIPAHAILVGKIVAAKNATGAYKIYSAFDTAFGGGGGGVSDHSQLSNLQGGSAGEYYHSTSDQYSTWSKITESGGLPLWNGSGWPGGGSNTGINSVNVYNTPTGYLTSTNTQGAINQLYTGKQDVLTNSSSLAKITTSSSGCPLWDGGSWPVSVSFLESGQYTIASGCGCAGVGTTQQTKRIAFGNNGRIAWNNNSGFWSGNGGQWSIASKVMAVATPSSNYPTICRIGGFDGADNAMILRYRRDQNPINVEFYCAIAGVLYHFNSTTGVAFDCLPHKLVATSNGTPTGLKVYLDGNLLSGNIVDEGVVNIGLPKMYIGGDPNENTGWNGFIDELAIFAGSTLSQTQISEWQTSTNNTWPITPTWYLNFSSGWVTDGIGGAVGDGTSFFDGFQII